MSANHKNPTKVVTGVVRLSYANVWEPASINGSNPKYSVSLIIPKTDTKTIDAINAAVDAATAKTKMPGDPVAGRASVFIVPDINTGNNLYKAVQRSAHAVAIGPVLQGLRKPVNDLSRGCTVPDIVNTVAITAIQAQAEKGLK